MWMPSVLGLFDGAATCTSDTRTASDREMVKWICWLFWKRSRLTLTPLLESIVIACGGDTAAQRRRRSETE